MPALLSPYHPPLCCLSLKVTYLMSLALQQDTQSVTIKSKLIIVFFKYEVDRKYKQSQFLGWVLNYLPKILIPKRRHSKYQIPAGIPKEAILQAKYISLMSITNSFILK